MLMRVKPIVILKQLDKCLKDDKPGKNEKVTYFKICSKKCPNCDTKRMTGCDS